MRIVQLNSQDCVMAALLCHCIIYWDRDIIGIESVSILWYKMTLYITDLICTRTGGALTSLPVLRLLHLLRDLPPSSLQLLHHGGAVALVVDFVHSNNL